MTGGSLTVLCHERAAAIDVGLVVKPELPLIAYLSREGDTEWLLVPKTVHPMTGGSLTILCHERAAAIDVGQAVKPELHQIAYLSKEEMEPRLQHP